MPGVVVTGSDHAGGFRLLADERDGSDLNCFGCPVSRASSPRVTTAAPTEVGGWNIEGTSSPANAESRVFADKLFRAETRQALRDLTPFSALSTVWMVRSGQWICLIRGQSGRKKCPHAKGPAGIPAGPAQY